MQRRVFLRAAGGIVTTGGLRLLFAQGESDGIVLMEVDPETEVLGESALATGGVALLLAARDKRNPAELASIDLANFSAEGKRLSLVPVLEAAGSLRMPARNLALDDAGTLWVLRSPAPGPNAEAEANAAPKKFELRHIQPGSSAQTFEIDLPWTVDTVVTALACDQGAVWGAVRSRTGAVVFRFDMKARTVISHAFDTSAGFYRFYRADANTMLAAAALLNNSGQLSVTTSLYLLDASLRPTATATVEGWVQDATYAAPDGKTPAVVHLAVTNDLEGSKSLSVTTLSADLRKVSTEDWGEPITAGSVLLAKKNHTVAIMCISAQTQQLFSRPMEQGAQKKAISTARTGEQTLRLRPLRSRTAAKQLRESLVAVSGRVRKRITVSPDLNELVR